MLTYLTNFIFSWDKGHWEASLQPIFLTDDRKLPCSFFFKNGQFEYINNFTLYSKRYEVLKGKYQTRWTLLLSVRKEKYLPEGKRNRERASLQKKSKWKINMWKVPCLTKNVHEKNKVYFQLTDWQRFKSTNSVAQVGLERQGLLDKRGVMWRNWLCTPGPSTSPSGNVSKERHWTNGQKCPHRDVHCSIISKCKILRNPDGQSVGDLSNPYCRMPGRQKKGGHSVQLTSECMLNST